MKIGRKLTLGSQFWWVPSGPLVTPQLVPIVHLWMTTISTIAKRVLSVEYRLFAKSFKLWIISILMLAFLSYYTFLLLLLLCSASHSNFIFDTFCGQFVVVIFWPNGFFLLFILFHCCGQELMRTISWCLPRPHSPKNKRSLFARYMWISASIYSHILILIFGYQNLFTHTYFFI